MEILREVCTCDDPIDEPCPRHKRENELQDLVIALRKENRILRDIVFGFNNHLLQMQTDCMKYLAPDNTEYEKDWFINRIIYHLDGPEQRAIQRQSKKSSKENKCHYTINTDRKNSRKFGVTKRP